MTEIVISTEPVLLKEDFNAAHCFHIYERSIADYHRFSGVGKIPAESSFDHGSMGHVLYVKNWIDDKQWHCEDAARDPNINPVLMVNLKREIDFLNQQRVIYVEALDDYLFQALMTVSFIPGARMNSETPGSILDRMSILALKIYHMEEQTRRTEAGSCHVDRCLSKLAILIEQKSDLTFVFDELMDDLFNGRKRHKVYRQIKMYNDPDTNPILYGTS